MATKDTIKALQLLLLNDNNSQDIDPKDSRDSFDLVLDNQLGLIQDELSAVPLTNTYIADNAITTSKHADLSVTVDKLATSSVSTAKIQAAAIQTASVKDKNITLPKLSQAVQDLLLAVGGGTITNNPDDEDLESVTSQLKFKDRTSSGNQKGYKIIRQNFDFTNIPSSYANSIWEIRYEHDVLGANITLPSNVTLKFTGGIITNYGTITGDDTKIDCGLSKIFDRSGILEGTWDLNDINPSWFEDINTNLGIQYAMDFAENIGGGCVKLEGKEYTVNSKINGRSKVSVVGCGLKTKLVAADGLNNVVFDLYAEYPIRRIDNLVISNFVIDGNNANQTTTDKLLGAGLAFRADVENPFTNGDPQDRGESENVVIKNILCQNCKTNGFYFGKNTFVTRSYGFESLKANNNVNGIYLDDFCEYITFSNLEIQNNQYGIRDEGSSNINFVGGIIANNTEAGIYFVTTGRNTFKKLVDGMLINHNKRGIWIGDGFGTVGKRIDHVTITNNHILATDRQGVLGVGGNDVIVKNNFFSGNGFESPGTYADIQMLGVCKRWDINNKHINSTGDTKNAILYHNNDASGADNHNYHKIDGTFEDYSTPIDYTQTSNPVTQPLNANTNIIQGVFEYWNNIGAPPSSSAANPNANLHVEKIPSGTICFNNADSSGLEAWIAMRTPSSSGAFTISFRKINTLSV